MTTPNDDALMQEALALLGQEPPTVIEPDSLEAAFDAEDPAEEAALPPAASPRSSGDGGLPSRGRWRCAAAASGCEQ